MKILQVIPCYWPAHRYGGPVKSVHELSIKLVKRGSDVTVFTTNADGPGNLEVPLGQSIDIDGVKVFYFPLQQPRSYFRTPVLGAALQKRVREFDIVHHGCPDV